MYAVGKYNIDPETVANLRRKLLHLVFRFTIGFPEYSFYISGNDLITVFGLQHYAMDFARERVSEGQLPKNNE